MIRLFPEYAMSDVCNGYQAILKQQVLTEVGARYEEICTNKNVLLEP
jgi:hypothetical protein